MQGRVSDKYYLENGNLTKPESIDILSSPLIHGFSEKIDRWYSYLDGDIAFAEKPKPRD